MTLFTSLLVGVDGRGIAAPALRRGAQLARRLGAELELFHSVEIPPPLWPGVAEDELREMHAKALERGRQAVARWTGRVLREEGAGEGSAPALSVAPGPASGTLARKAEEVGADLLLLGPHEKRSLFDFGSTARGVLADAPCSVWREPTESPELTRLLVAIDFSEPSRVALQRAHALAQRLALPLAVRHFYASPDFAYAPEDPSGPIYTVEQERRRCEESLDEWMEELDWTGLDVEHQVVEREPVDGILEAARPGDLIVMGTQGRTGLPRFLLGSIAYATLKHSPGPVLAIRCRTPTGA